MHLGAYRLRPSAPQRGSLSRESLESYRDSEPAQGEPTQTNADYHGLSGALGGPLGTTGVYEALWVWVGSPQVGSESLYDERGILATPQSRSHRTSSHQTSWFFKGDPLKSTPLGPLSIYLPICPSISLHICIYLYVYIYLYSSLCLCMYVYMCVGH